MTYILHIDTSGDMGIIALAADGKLVSQRTNPDSRSQAGTINTHINEVVAEVGITLKELSAVAVCGGPGSYTGLRVGLSTAKGLCYALDIPLLMHNRLLLNALGDIEAGNTNKQYASLSVAREAEYFVAIYDNKLNAVFVPQHMPENELQSLIKGIKLETILICDFDGLKGKIKLNDNIQVIINKTISIEKCAEYSYEKYNCNDFVNMSAAEPFYLKQVYTHNKL